MENMNDSSEILCGRALDRSCSRNPALAAESDVAHRRNAVDSYASVTPDTGSYTERTCVRAPDVGAFASDPWKQPPCESNTGF
jgi:hypothetical protein